MGVVVDTSAIVSLLLPDEDADFFAVELSEAAEVFVGSPTALECALVLERLFPRLGRSRFDEWLTRTSAQIVPFTEHHFRSAHDAFLSFGKGRHRAGLNYGDCLSFAVAAVADLPLLQKGDDFPLTSGIALLNPKLRPDRPGGP
ncbi:MAG: type II toxin-antitoxin system VapC family toxin [Myxococcaceae bacterium]